MVFLSLLVCRFFVNGGVLFVVYLAFLWLLLLDKLGIQIPSLGIWTGSLNKA